MFRTRRSLAGGLIAALTTVGLVAAGSSFGTAGTSTSATLPPVVGIGKAHIVGVVVDQGDRKVDAVTVKAYDEETDEVVASSYTYANEDDSIEHGYLHLRVRAGSYRVTLTKAGYGRRTIEGVVVGRRQTADLETVRVRKLPAPTATTGKLKDDTVTTDQRAKVVVAVSTRSSEKRTGSVKVKIGRTVVGADTLTRSDAGRTTITLDKLRKGSYALKVYYAGNLYLQASESKRLGLTVRKAGR